MSAATLNVLPLGDSAWTIEFGQSIDVALHAQVMALAERVQQARRDQADFAAITDVVPTFRSLTVHFDPDHAGGLNGSDSLAERLASALATMAQATGQHQATGEDWRLPACFAEAEAPDLAQLARDKGLTVDAVLARLLATRFQVYMIGFLPGFPYMGGLPAELALPRRANPRAKVPARSIAIADQMCAVYPWDSPGGWHLIGRTPLNLFELNHPTQAAWLSAGDRVTWYEVTPAMCTEIEAAFLGGELQRCDFLAAATAGATS